MDWLGTYRHWTKDYEAPDVYHKWSAVTVFAHALGRRIFCALDGMIVFPGHMMTLLVGPPAILRKSSTAGRAAGLIANAQDRCKDPSRLNFMADRVSNESIFDNLYGEADPENVDCMGFLYASEFSSIANKNSYMEEIPEILCNLYDCALGEYEPETRTVKPAFFKRRFRRDAATGGLRLRNPGITLLACTTSTHMQKTLPPYIRSTGFLSRVLVIYAERSNRPPNPLTNTDPERWHTQSWLTDQLALATEIEGEVVMTPACREAYEAWYAKKQLQIRGVTEDSIVHGFASRSHLHALRLAIIFAGINQLGHPVRNRLIPMELSYWEAATNWIQAIENTLPAACGELAQDRSHRCEERLLNGIRLRTGTGKKKWANYRDVFTYTCKGQDRFKRDEIKTTLERLLDLHTIEREIGRAHV